MGPFLLTYEGFFSGNIYYKHCKFNLIFSHLVSQLKNPAKTKVFYLGKKPVSTAAKPLGSVLRLSRQVFSAQDGCRKKFKICPEPP
jgi:hypothetical protein